MLIAMAKRYDYVLLFVGCFILFNMVSLVMITSSDVAPATFLPAALILNHDFYFDFATSLTTDPVLSYAFLYRDGHYVSLFPVVTPVLVTPVYVLSYILCNLTGIPLQAEDFLILGKTSAALIASLAVVIFYLAAREIFTRRTALLTAGIFAFATSTWSISSQALWQTGMVELLLIAMIWVIFLDAKRPQQKYIIVLGILSGLFFFNRPPDALLLIPVLAYLYLHRRSVIPQYAAGACAGGLPFLAYNFLLFGNFLGGYKENVGRYIISPEIITNSIALVIAPNIGILVFSPVLILAAIGIFCLKDLKNPDIRELLVIFVPVIILHIMLYSAFDGWYSASAYCYGPRYLTGIIPVVTLYAGLILARVATWDGPEYQKRLAQAAIAGLIIVSVCIQLVGVLFYPYNPDKTMPLERIWDTSDLLIAESYTTGAQAIEKITFYTLPPIPPLYSYTFHHSPGS